MKHASLFSGIGGPEIAAAMLGWENVFHCEINEFGRKVLDYWFPNSDSYEDITKTDFTKYRGKVDVLTGGFPCQPFSYAGKRGGAEDQRYLWPQMLRVINEIRPSWVIGENVAGIATMVEQCRITEMGAEATLFEEGDGIHRYHAEFTFTIERICRDLESVGYSVQPMLIPACAVGAPHRRDRVFIIACNVADTKNLLINGSDARYRGDGVGQEIPKLGGCDCEAIADSGCEGLEEWLSGRFREDQKKEKARLDNRTERFSVNGGITRMLPGERWAAFPTISAVHRGNDGLPFDVDNLAVSFAKWRTESLKAYGNAIVPQVMYRIFEAIEAVEATR